MNSAKNKSPRLFALMLLCAALPIAASAQNAARRGPAQRDPNIAEQYLLAMANQERAQRNIQPLAWDPHLAAAALQHAERMARQNAISHQFPGEPALESRTAAAGAHFRLIAENVAIAPTPQVLHTAWMNSPGHRANLLEPHENAVGIAVIQSNGALFAVEDFSEQVATVGLNAQESQVAALLHGYGIASVQATAGARQSCTMDSGYAGTQRPYFVMRYTTSDLSLLPQELTGRLRTDKRLHRAEVGACTSPSKDFSSFSIAVLLYP